MRKTSLYVREVEQLRFQADDLFVHADEFVLDVFSVGHFLVIFFAKSGVIQLGSGHLSVVLIDDAVRLLDFGAEGSPHVLTDSRHFFRPSLVQSLL